MERMRIPRAFMMWARRWAARCHPRAFFASGRVAQPAERSYATVIGAGAYSVAVSGSTICYQGLTFPLPALPTGKVPFAGPEDLAGLEAAVRGAVPHL